MTRLRPFVVGLVLVGVTSVWFTGLRANEEPAELSQPDQVAQLLSRIEKLEKRIAALEADKEQSTRQANAAYPAPLQQPAIVQPSPLPSAADSRIQKEPKKKQVQIWMHLRNGEPD